MRQPPCCFSAAAADGRASANTRAGRGKDSRARAKRPCGPGREIPEERAGMILMTDRAGAKFRRAAGSRTAQVHATHVLIGQQPGAGVGKAIAAELERVTAV